MQTLIEQDWMWQSFDRDNEQHIYAIDKLVHELGVPAEDVNSSYREILEEMQTVTKKTILPCLVSSSVRRRLRTKSMTAKER